MGLAVKSSSNRSSSNSNVCRLIRCGGDDLVSSAIIGILKMVGHAVETF